MNTTFSTYEQLTSKNGRNYYRFIALDGQKYTCFEDAVTNQLLSSIGQPVEVEVVTKNGFNNIRKILGKANSNVPAPAPIQALAPVEVKGLPPATKSQLLSYAKDIFIALLATGDNSDYMDYGQIVDMILKEYNKM